MLTRVVFVAALLLGFVIFTHALPCNSNVDLGIISSECGDLCTFQDGINQCLDECSGSENISCNIQFSGVMTGPGNSNITFIGASNITGLHILGEGQITMDYGYFIYVDNSLNNFYIGSDSQIEIIGCTETAISFVSSDVSSSISLQGNILFSDCHTSNGSPPGLFIETAGTIGSLMVLFSITSSSGNCGAAALNILPSTTYTEDLLSFSFEDTYAAGNGGALCISTAENVTFRVPHFGYSACFADNGGALYLSGPGNFILGSSTALKQDVMFRNLIAENGYAVYAENFGSILFQNCSFSSPLTTPQSAQNGAYYLTSSRPGSTVEILDSKFVLTSTSVGGNGAGFYIKDVSDITISNVNFESGVASFGFGGAVLFDGVGTINLNNVVDTGTTAGKGAGFACIGGVTSPITIEDVSIFGAHSTQLDFENQNIYSDGTCTDPFWYSGTPCPTDCDSCSTSVCGLSYDYQSVQYCYCYCDSSNPCNITVPTPSITPSSSPTPNNGPSSSPFPLVSSTLTPSVTMNATSSNTPGEQTEEGGLDTIWIIFIVIACIGACILLIVIIAIALFFGKNQIYSKFYDTIDARSPDTPQHQNEDDLYQ